MFGNTSAIPFSLRRRAQIDAAYQKRELFAKFFPCRQGSPLAPNAKRVYDGGELGPHRRAPASRRAFRFWTIVASRDKIMPKEGHNIHIPLPEAEALRLLLKVKPTADMPRPGANPTGKKKPKKR